MGCSAGSDRSVGFASSVGETRLSSRPCPLLAGGSAATLAGGPGHSARAERGGPAAPFVSARSGRRPDPSAGTSFGLPLATTRAALGRAWPRGTCTYAQPRARGPTASARAPRASRRGGTTGEQDDRGPRRAEAVSRGGRRIVRPSPPRAALRRRVASLLEPAVRRPSGAGSAHRGRFHDPRQRPETHRRAGIRVYHRRRREGLLLPSRRPGAPPSTSTGSPSASASPSRSRPAPRAPAPSRCARPSRRHASGGQLARDSSPSTALSAPNPRGTLPDAATPRLRLGPCSLVSRPGACSPPSGAVRQSPGASCEAQPSRAALPTGYPTV